MPSGLKLLLTDNLAFISVLCVSLGASSVICEKVLDTCRMLIGVSFYWTCKLFRVSLTLAMGVEDTEWRFQRLNTLSSTSTSRFTNDDV